MGHKIYYRCTVEILVKHLVVKRWWHLIFFFFKHIKTKFLFYVFNIIFIFLLVNPTNLVTIDFFNKSLLSTQEQNAIRVIMIIIFQLLVKCVKKCHQHVLKIILRNIFFFILESFIYYTFVFFHCFVIEKQHGNMFQTFSL